MSGKILIIDDDKNLNELVQDKLEAEGYTVAAAFTGADGLALFRQSKPDLVLLDWRLPDKDGLEVCQTLKSSAGGCPPIIMLSGLSRESDKVSSLEGGADDYLTKPFSLKELSARIKVQLRKAPESPQSTPGAILSGGGITLNPLQRTVTVNDKAVELPPKAFQLLRVMMENKERVMSRDQLMEKVWGHEYLETTRVVDVHIAGLRKKLGTAAKHIMTVERLGYKFTQENRE